ncbi:carbohydrate ABC transporter permease [Pseudoclostridium thermosuccinogenes]|uniref:carbohydrate ABC transporter permease n=1 Tax=Clostridium thermosuccinogenes TaxID=84032 RepID=UPI0018764900
MKHIKQSFGSKVFDIINVLLMILLIVITLYPFYYIIIVSLSDGKAVMKGLVKLRPVGINFKSYSIVLKDPYIGTAYLNTILYTTFGTFINILFSTLCAYPLSRKNFFGKRIFTVMIVFTMFFSGGLIPTYLTVQKLGMLDTIWALVLPGAINTYNMIIIRTFFQDIPAELHESAYIDGANDIKIFAKIILPLSKPIIATMTLFYAVGHWNSFFSALIYLNEREKYPLQIVLRNMVVSGELTSQSNQMGAAADFLAIDTTIKYAVIIVATLPILVVYPFVQKYFVKGVMIGSLKG